MEQKFIQSQKMQAIGELAGGIAHDFNNLLTAIRGHCDLLMMGLAPDAPGYTDLDQINQTVNRAAGLVNQLLGFSRKQRIEPEIIDLSDAMGELMHLLNRLVGKKIKLNLVHSSDSVCIRADPRQLEQVIMNLVLNARDAMPGGGQVFVETTPVTLDAPLHRDNVEIPAGSYVLLKVRDEGHGIADDKRARIFEPFFTTKRTGEGTGLGLSMVYGIVKQTGGYVFVDSVLGQGTTFSIYYPSYERPAQSDTGHGPDREAQKNQPAGPLHVSGATILLVEDEASVRRFAARALQLQGHIVIEAENAEDALNLLPQIMHQVDLFVTDIVMPGMDGPTWVARALRDVPDVQTIFISGYADGLPDQDISHIPGAVFLQKPFSLKQLVHVVQTQLSDR